MTTRTAKSIRRLVLPIFSIFTIGLMGQANATDPGRGGALAERWCTSCHVVADDVPGGTLGPAFSGIVPIRGRQEAQLKGWLATPHGEVMPDFNLSAREINDIVAYILSLNGDL